ncbi:MAG: hypothetical protein Q9214_006802 [Letrouitia sp. 1 TL-2023]
MSRLARLDAQLFHILLLLLCYAPFIIAAGSTISIQDDPSYLGLRECVRSNLYCQLCGDDLRSDVDCQTSESNICFCRSDLASSAPFYLSSRVVTDCTYGTVDVAAAQSVYDQYCESAMGSAKPTAATPRVTSDTLDTTKTVNAYVTSIIRKTSVVVNEIPLTPPPTTTNGNGRRTSVIIVTSVVHNGQPTSLSESTGETAGAKSGGRLTISDKIALGVGLGVGGATLIVTVMMCLKCYEPLRRIIPKGLPRRAGESISPPSFG